MTEQPPPPPPDEPDQGVFVPLQQVQGIAKMWVQWRGLIGLGARMAKQKIPRELDEAMETLAATGNAERLQNLAQNPQRQPYDIQQGELPEPRIGERVLTHDDGMVAWRMHYKQGLGYRDIANYFTNELGCPVSHTTISNYIAEIDEDMEENKGARLKTIATVIIVPVVIGVAGFLLGHFFFK